MKKDGRSDPAVRILLSVGKKLLLLALEFFENGGEKLFGGGAGGFFRCGFLFFLLLHGGFGELGGLVGGLHD